jgi:hypothetical protein
MIAALHGFEEVALHLIDKGARLTDKNLTSGVNAVHLASNSGCVKVINAIANISPQYLIEKDVNGNGAIKYAKDNKTVEAIVRGIIDSSSLESGQYNEGISFLSELSQTKEPLDLSAPTFCVLMTILTSDNASNDMRNLGEFLKSSFLEKNPEIDYSSLKIEELKSLKDSLYSKLFERQMIIMNEIFMDGGVMEKFQDEYIN